MELEEILKTLPENNDIIKDNMIKAYTTINDPNYNKIFCSVSGGSDSDLILDICHKCDKDNKVSYGWFDTGLEYQATKDHLKYLEKKYDITIERIPPKLPIPLSCKKYGEPFYSKFVSEMIQRLQHYGFDWVDEDYDTLVKKYPKCQSALSWWCNNYDQGSRFNIERCRYLKEFMIQNPPNFQISNKCCNFAKKQVAHDTIKNGNYDLDVVGIRRAEGGIRNVAYKSCFSEKAGTADEYRPIFWYSNADKKEYEDSQDIIHSECYTTYGLPRTGCFGCPYGQDFESELKTIEKYEPKLYNAAIHIFANAYEYTRKYHAFRDEMDKIYGNHQNYLRSKREKKERDPAIAD